MKNINYFKFSQWIIFAPIIIPISILTGALEGLMKVVDQAVIDISQTEDVNQ